MAIRDHSLRVRLRDRLTTVRRAVLRRRRLLAVLFTVGAVATALRATVPPPAPTVEVLVAAADLPAGAVLDAEDLTTRPLPPDSVPDRVLTDLADAAGAILAAPVRAGEPITDVRLVGPGLAASAPGTVAVPVRLSDAAQAGLLAVGDAIDLLATDPESRTTDIVASGVVVLAVPTPDQEAPDALTGRLVVVGIPASGVAEVTAAAVTGFVTYAWASR
jgi:Flp pilus assembly protein CpaB